MKLTIEPKAPFDFDLTMGLYGRFSTHVVDKYNPGNFQRVLQLENSIHLVSMSSIGTVREPKVAVSVVPPTKDNKVVVETAKRMMGAEDDVDEFYEVVRSNKQFSSIISRLYGLRIPRTPSIFEALITAITEQQTAIKTATKIRAKLIMRYGKPLNVTGADFYAFPTPDSLQCASIPEIRDLGLNQRKAECIVTISKKVANGELDLELFRYSTIKEAKLALTPINGVGPWTVEYMLCRGLGRFDALPANDIGLKHAISKFHRGGEKVTEGIVRKILDPLGKFKGYAAFYLISAYALEKYATETEKKPKINRLDKWIGQ